MPSTSSLENLRRTHSAPHVQLPPNAHTHTSQTSRHSQRQRRSDLPEDLTPDVESWRRSTTATRLPHSTPTSPIASTSSRTTDPPRLTASLDPPQATATAGDASGAGSMSAAEASERARRILAARAARRRPQLPSNAGLLSRVRFFFGYGRDGDRARKARFHFLVGMAWYFSQLTACITILAIAAHRQSPTLPRLNEWNACHRPIQAWVLVWALKTTLSMGLCRWTYVRDRQIRHNMDLLEHAEADINAMRGALNPASPSGPTPAPTEIFTDQRRRELETIQRRTLPRSAIYSRLSMLSTLLTLVWFLTAHILEYTTIDTCRLSSPHLWWMIFAIMCIMYVMVLEVLFLGFVVFVLAPITFLFCNILLLIIGRHPYQNPNNAVLRPEIGKLSKSVVDQIPLVIYIPPPPDADKDEPPTVVEKHHNTKPPKSDSSFAYPPTSKPKEAKKKFRFLRLKKKAKAKPAADGDRDEKEKEETNSSDPADAELGQAGSRWEENWEEHEAYPFVRIGGNRAVCSICLLDFEEPARRAGAQSGSGAQSQHPSAGGSGSGAGESSASAAADVSSVVVGTSTDAAREEGGAEQHVVVEEEPRNQEEADKLKLADAGASEGPELLRLLSCGHAFHQACVDPWLTNVSGRCPVCQQPIEAPEKQKQKNR